MPDFTDFEWDEAKRALTLKKHGVDFRTAIRIFDGPVMRVPSDRNDERRELALGVVDDAVIALVSTVRNGRCRVISARKANRYERKNITRMSLEEAILRQNEEKTDWKRLKREREAGIEPEPDPEEGDFDWSKAEIVMPPPKTAISIRLDDDVLDFFKSKGNGYQTRINAVLRIYMKANRESGPDR